MTQTHSKTNQDKTEIIEWRISFRIRQSRRYNECLWIGLELVLHFLFGRIKRDVERDASTLYPEEPRPGSAITHGLNELSA